MGNTCLVPMKERESLADSSVWRIMLEAARGPVADVARAPTKLATDALQDQVDLLKDDTALLRMVTKQVALECQNIDGGIDLKSALVHGFEKRMNMPLLAQRRDFLQQPTKPDKPSQPVLNMGQECFRSCGSSGNCSTGFCGRGACCKFGEPNYYCPPGGGCKGQHCCIDSAVVEPAQGAVTLSCEAKPGFYCLASMAKQGGGSLDAGERCMIERSVMICPPGFFCSGGMAPPRACARGRQCPVGSSEEKACPAGSFCPISIWKMKCLPGFSCWENRVSPDVCGGGKYCPDGVERICPAGHFCPDGSQKPTPCALIASCPEGSQTQEVRTFGNYCLILVLVSFSTLYMQLPKWLKQKGDAVSRVPLRVAIALLAAGWGAKFDLVYRAAKLVLVQDPWYLQMARIFGTSVDATVPLLFTVIGAVLWYGLRVSYRIRHKPLRSMADCAVAALICALAVACMMDIHAVLFLGTICGAFMVTWLFINQKGTWTCRMVLLSVICLGVYIGFWYVEAPMLAHVFAISITSTIAKEFMKRIAKSMCLSLRSWSSATGGDDHCDWEAPFRPLISWVTPEVELESMDGGLAGAVKTTTRACLDAPKSIDADDRQGSMASDDKTRVAWAEYNQRCREIGTDRGSNSGKAHAVSFDLRNICYRLGDNRNLLEDLSFVVPGGSTVAIMGASGAGKTTLLSVISGRCGDGRFVGEMRLNDVPILPWQMAEIRPLIGYVPQDDVMHLALTVRENIEYQAKLRLRRSTKTEKGSITDALKKTMLSAGSDTDCTQELNASVGTVITGLGLTHAHHRRIADGLSGGQRKRVSIGMEMVTKPKVLLLDEPSSGLDSSTAHRILDMVCSNAASEQCTTFATIHQPRWSTLSLFDMLVLLAPGGYLCYAGPVMCAKGYFHEVLHVDFPEDQNPADVIIDATTYDSARDMIMEGTWKNPPQSLRAVLIPTPEAAHLDPEQQTLPWKQREFGKVLAAHWLDFAEENVEIPPSPVSEPGFVLTPAEDARAFRPAPSQAQGSWQSLHHELAMAARQRADMVHWAQQVWAHFTRQLLLTSRVFYSTVMMYIIALLVTLRALSLAFPGQNLQHMFLPSGLMFMLVVLAQSVAAQRTFGGDERGMSVREASVSSLSQVVYSFIGKDLSSLVEVVFAALCYTFFYWPRANVFASAGDVFEIGFGLLYAVYGVNHVFAILLPQQPAMIMAVICGFLSFLFCGLKPEAHNLGPSGDGLGWLLLLASPIRWCMTQWLYKHVTGVGTPYLEEPIMGKISGWFDGRGYRIIGSIASDGVASQTMSVKQRWIDHQGWVSHSGHLFLLGLLFRFIAVTCLLIIGSSRASGGELPLGLSSLSKSRILRDCIFVMLVFASLFSLLLLGETS